MSSCFCYRGQHCSFLFVILLVVCIFADFAVVKCENVTVLLADDGCSAQVAVPDAPHPYGATSLMQASSYMSTLRLESGTSAASSKNIRSEVFLMYENRWRIVLLVVVFVAGMLVIVKLCLESKSISGEASEDLIQRARTRRRLEQSSQSTDEKFESEYESFSETESDTGEYAFEDLDRMGVVNSMMSRVGSAAGVLKSGKEALPTGHVAGTASRVDSTKAVTESITEKFTSWKLLAQIFGTLVEFWAALAFMYWSLLQKEEELMKCSDYKNTNTRETVIRHVCYYTYACLRGFPILAANMVLMLMVRIMLQNRIYYSMLKVGYVLDFAAPPVWKTIWPWACGLSMLQGGLHFALKALLIKEGAELEVMYLRLVRKFVLPGTIFFSFLMRYVDIENTLVPLNRICELDYDHDSKKCAWLSSLQVMDERVLAFDARHRDVIGHTSLELGGRAPTIDEIVANILAHYERAKVHWAKRTHRDWGLFKSMWPARVLVDRRINRADPDTRAWVLVFGILVCGSGFVSILSLYLLFYRMLMFNNASETDCFLSDLVLVVHGLLIMLFIYSTVANMRAKDQKFLKAKTSSRQRGAESPAEPSQAGPAREGVRFAPDSALTSFSPSEVS